MSEKTNCPMCNHVAGHATDCRHGQLERELIAAQQSLAQKDAQIQQLREALQSALDNTKNCEGFNLEEAAKLELICNGLHAAILSTTPSSSAVVPKSISLETAQKLADALNRVTCSCKSCVARNSEALEALNQFNAEKEKI